MYKIFILFLGFFLLTSCNTPMQNPVSEIKTETTKTETQKQENTTEKISYFSPFANIELESKDEINGIQFYITTFIESHHNNILQRETNADNKKMLLDFEGNIFENFSEFKDNPTTESSTGNITISHGTYYNLLNTIYNPSISENKKINQEKTKLSLGFTQNYNKNYTGSLWDLPLISLYCEYCFEAGQKANDVIIWNRNNNSQEPQFTMEKTVHWENWLLSSAAIGSIDATHDKIPNTLIYDFQPEKLSDIFNILKNEKYTDNDFIISIKLPKSHWITKILYEYNNIQTDVTDIMGSGEHKLGDREYIQYTLYLSQIRGLMKNESWKIIVNISEK